MSAALTLANDEHFAQLLVLVAAFHEESGIHLTEDARSAAIKPLLQGSPHGAVYLIGPPRSPIGYIVIAFGWSIEFGGMDGFIDEVYIRPRVRGRGIAKEVLTILPRALAEAGLKALHLEVSSDEPETQKLYARVGFRVRDQYCLMTRRL